MDYRPNVEAVTWFADNVMSEFDRSCGIEFWIVGSNPSSAVRRLAKRRGVHVTGRVDDVRPYLLHADAVVAPLLTARGIQNKVLEAMAMAKPVIATPQAKEGIEAADGEELLVASDAAEFAAAVQSALAGEGRRLGERARERVVFHYSWSRSLEAVEQHLRGGMPPLGLEHPRAKRTIAK